MADHNNDEGKEGGQGEGGSEGTESASEEPASLSSDVSKGRGLRGGSISRARGEATHPASEKYCDIFYPPKAKVTQVQLQPLPVNLKPELGPGLNMTTTPNLVSVSCGPDKGVDIGVNTVITLAGDIRAQTLAPSTSSAWSKPCNHGSDEEEGKDKQTTAKESSHPPHLERRNGAGNPFHIILDEISRLHSSRPGVQPVKGPDLSGRTLDGCVGGLTSQRKAIKGIVKAFVQHKALRDIWGVEAAPRGVLFHGPPGTGKTLLAQTIVGELALRGIKANFLVRKGSDLFDKYVGESEKKVKEFFELAVKKKPSVVFLDELDALCPDRNSIGLSSSSHTSSVVCALLTAMETIPRGEVLVIGATNRIGGIDPALKRPGRFDKEIFFTLPNTEGRKQILRIHTKKWMQQPSDENLDYVAAQTEGYTGADLEQLCRQVFNCALERTEAEMERKNGYAPASDDNRKLPEPGPASPPPKSIYETMEIFATLSHSASRLLRRPRTQSTSTSSMDDLGNLISKPGVGVSICKCSEQRDESSDIIEVIDLTSTSDEKSAASQIPVTQKLTTADANTQTETALTSFERMLKEMRVLLCDWGEGLLTSRRSPTNSFGGCAFQAVDLQKDMQPLLGPVVKELHTKLETCYPKQQNENANTKFTTSCLNLKIAHFWTQTPSDLIILNTHILPGVLAFIDTEKIPIYLFDFKTIGKGGGGKADGAGVGGISALFDQIDACTKDTCILFAPSFPSVWERIEQVPELQHAFIERFEATRGRQVVLVMTSADGSGLLTARAADSLDWLKNCDITSTEVRKPNDKEREQFFDDVLYFGTKSVIAEASIKKAVKTQIEELYKSRLDAYRHELVKCSKYVSLGSILKLQGQLALFFKNLAAEEHIGDGNNGKILLFQEYAHKILFGLKHLIAEFKNPDLATGHSSVYI